MKHEMKRGAPDIEHVGADTNENGAAATPSVWAVAIVIDRDKGKTANRLEFHKLGGGTGTLDVERGRVGRPSDIVAALKTAGAILPSLPKDEASDHVIAAMNAVPDRTIVKVFRGGWQDQCSGFARPNWHLGDKEYVWGNPHDCAAPPSEGTAKAWRRGLKPACSKSAYLSVAVGISFAAVLLEFLGEQEGAIFHLSGRTTRGKTLSLRAAQSVFHRAHVVDVEAASASSKRIEEFCHARNSAALILDEHGRQKGVACPLKSGPP